MKLSLYMEEGAEIELFAIAKCRSYNIITHDLENTDFYHKNFGRIGFWVYDLFKLFYLAHKANLLSIEDAEKALCSLKGISKYIPKGFKKYVEDLDGYKEKHIDPKDSDKF